MLIAAAIAFFHFGGEDTISALAGWDAAARRQYVEEVELNRSYLESAENLEAQEREVRLERVEDKFGRAVRLRYELCGSFAPKLPKNQKACQQLAARVDASINRDEAREKSW
jgi:hypothetical protein